MTFNCPRCGRIVTNDGDSLVEALPSHYAEGCQVFPPGPDRKARAEREGRAEGLLLTGGPRFIENPLRPAELEGFVADNNPPTFTVKEAKSEI